MHIYVTFLFQSYLTKLTVSTAILELYHAKHCRVEKSPDCYVVEDLLDKIRPCALQAGPPVTQLGMDVDQMEDSDEDFS